MSKVFVTGGCGFIGSNFIRYLLRTDPELQIINYDSLTYAGNLENLQDVSDHPNYQFIHGDITNREQVEKAMRGADGVIHFAAESHVDRSIHDSGPFVHTNIIGTQILLDVAKAFGIAKYVQVSTDEVYGSLGDTGFFTEDTPLAPNSPYSASKAAADLLVRSYVHTFGFPACITRCSNNYGPYQFPEKLIPLFITNLMQNEPVPVYGDGLNVRDWLHVNDHCVAIDLVWRKGRIGEVYNIGGKCEKTNLDLTHTLLDCLGKPKSLIRYVKDRPGHDRRYAIDCRKIEEELGWSPVVQFEDGLRETIEWYETHQDWVSNIRSGEYRSYYEKQYGSQTLA
ncbi:MAG: dTDP-glucose 4,6-dehydratase [Gemmataceae bacterium]